MEAVGITTLGYNSHSTQSMNFTYNKTKSISIIFVAVVTYINEEPKKITRIK